MAAKNMLDETYLTDTEPEEKDEPGAEAPEGEVEPAEPAAAAARTPVTPVTRRQRAKERDESILKELKDTRELLTTREREASERESRRDRELAEMRGHLAGIASRPAPEARRVEPEKDPDDILKDAYAALDNKDMAGWTKKFAEYNKAVVFADPRFQRQAPAPQQPTVNPMLQMVATQYVDVMSDEVAFTHAQSMDRLYAKQGLPDGPDRWKRAFEEGRRFLGASKPKPAQTFSTKSREVLSGVPTARGGAMAAGEGGEPGVTLTDQERQMAKRFKMKESEYAQHLVAMHPERIER